MKLMQISDPHLGAVPDSGHPWSQDRADALWHTFARAVARAEEEQADLLLIPGDLFHRPPLIRELKEVNAIFARLTHTKVVLIAGNHDCITESSNYLRFSWCPQVTFFQDSQIQKATFPELNVTVYGRSYHSREDTGPLYKPVVLEPENSIHILLAHGGDATHCPFRRSELSNAGFHYVALGHIHKPDMDFSDGIVSPGSLEPIDASDYGPHGFAMAEVSLETTQVQWIPFASAEYVSMEFQVTPSTTGLLLTETITKTLQERGREHIYKIRLTGRKDPDITFAQTLPDPALKILKWEDLTEPDYRFDALAAAHADDLIGAYIRTLSAENSQNADPPCAHQKQLREKALYYGVKALLDTMHPRQKESDH